MTWTYTGDPSSSLKDAVRFLIQDTSPASPQLQDGEIAWLLTEAGNDAYQAAISACTSLMALYARKSDKTTGDLQIRSSSISKQYADLRKILKTEALRRVPATPYAGGISLSDMETDADNTDRVQPAIRVGFMDSPGGANPLDGFDLTRDFD